MLPLHPSFAAMDGDAERPQCTCEKTECLQRYCRCFEGRWYCSEECSCRACRNTEENEDEVEERVDNIMRKKHDAFTLKIACNKIDATMDSVIPTQGKEARVHVKGCNCRKSGCKKQYCECHRHKVGCSARCRCTGCANSYGAKGVSGTDQHKVDGNGNPNETSGGSQSCSSMPASETDGQEVDANGSPNGTSSGSQSCSSMSAPKINRQKVDGNGSPNEQPGGSQSCFTMSAPKTDRQKVDDNGSPNELHPGGSQFCSSIAAPKTDRQKVDDSGSPNGTSGGSQSCSSMAVSEIDQPKVDDNGSIPNETSGGSGGTAAGSNETLSLSDDDIFNLPTYTTIPDDFLANPGPWSVDAQIQPLGDDGIDDIFLEPFGDGDDFLSNTHPQTYQGSAHADEPQLNEVNSMPLDPSNLQPGNANNDNQNNSSRS